MRRRLSSIGILLIVAALVLVGLIGCSRPASERESQAPEETQEAVVPPSPEPATPVPGETIVSAVTPAPPVPTLATSGTEEQPTQVAVAETPTISLPEATAEPGMATAGPPPTAVPSSSGTGGTIWHTVQPGETLSSIARKYGTTWQAIAQANNITDPNQIYVGQKIKVSEGGGSSTGSSTASGCRIRHTVKQGEWIWQLARNYGVSPYDILAANGLTVQTANNIYPGMVLCIP
jgi:LysM repeat protein